MTEKKDVILYIIEQLQEIESYMNRADKAYERLINRLKEYIENE